ncbi:disease resistance protein RGA2-like [Papaver somniferum]|uniref:disease resistance protein RGA2-like n=1 Tax=Papaver somniferum TaxID=3469 RepID=UPI000E7035D1|nr:disease resistance protein RGA2-like [Papaver somniferum]
MKKWVSDTSRPAGILNKVVDAVAREIDMEWGVEDDLQKLQNTVEMVLAKIVDAEQKHGKNNELRCWLKSLKDIAYEADDIMDSFSYEAMRRQHEKRSVKNKVLGFVSSSNPLAFRLSMAKKLKDINKRLEVVSNDMGNFQLQSTPSNTIIAHDDSSEQLSLQTRSSVDESETLESKDDKCWSIISKKAFSQGRALKTSKMTKKGKEISKIYGGLPLAESDWLSIQQNNNWDSPGSQNKVIPIPRSSYDILSSQLKQCFSYCSLFPKDWEINRETLIQLWMAEGFLDSSLQNNRSMEDTGKECFERLLGSSFLEGIKKNVLGDVTTWKMHDLVHDLAQAVVGDGECVSLKVSELNNVSEVRRLELTMDSAIFPETTSNIKKLRTLIVLKPIYTLNLNRFSRHMRVLHLGRPGLNCSDILFSTSKLRHLRYLNLSSINFSVGKKLAESITRFYNLQTLVLRGCLHVQDVLRNIESLNNLRHLDISFTDIEELPDSVTSLCTLQRLDLNHCRSLTSFPKSATGLKYLRFLDMSFTPIEELPAFISSLHNLQTLDLTNCSRLGSVPDYVTSLEYLSIFNFEDCTLVKTLPKNFGDLTQLRSLNLGGTGVKVLPDSCVSLKNLEFLNLFMCELPQEVKYWKKLREFYYRIGTPVGVGELVCLQTLIYRVGENVLGKSESNNGIEEIGNLNFLEKLHIMDLQNVKDTLHAARANLQRKQNLQFLGLCYAEKLLEEKCYSDSNTVLEALQPPTNLRILKIVNFMGWDFPTWMCVPSLPNLEQLELENCKEIRQLPAAIEQFPGLRFLNLKRMSLKSLDIGLPAVHEISLTDMFYLEEICCFCPFLQTLQIVDCKILVDIASFPSLQHLYLEKIDHKLVSSIGRSFTSLTKLLLKHVEELDYFPVNILQNNRNLQILSIDGCKKFEGFLVEDGEDEITLFGSLQRLVLMDCPVLKFVPDLRKWNSLWKLTIFRCPRLLASLTYDLKSLSYLKELYVDLMQRNEQHEDVYYADDLINLLQ